MKKLYFLKSLAVIMFLTALSIVLGFICIEEKLTAHNLPYKAPLFQSIDYDITRPSNISFTSLKDEVDKLFDSPSYTLEIKDLEGTVKGKCEMFKRNIILDNNLSYEYFAFCLAHELTHLTEFCYSERYINLTAFNKLYSSGNEYLTNVALYFADLDLRGAFSQEYSFVGYIEI